MQAQLDLKLKGLVDGTILGNSDIVTIILSLDFKFNIIATRQTRIISECYIMTLSFKKR